LCEGCAATSEAEAAMLRLLEIRLVVSNRKSSQRLPGEKCSGEFFLCELSFLRKKRKWRSFLCELFFFAEKNVTQKVKKGLSQQNHQTLYSKNTNQITTRMPTKKPQKYQVITCDI